MLRRPCQRQNVPSLSTTRAPERNYLQKAEDAQSMFDIVPVKYLLWSPTFVPHTDQLEPARNH
jgi:hypothetical protein